MTDLFAGALPRMPSPRLLKQQERYDNHIMRALLHKHIDLDNPWPDAQRMCLERYLAYVHSVATRMKKPNVVAFVQATRRALKMYDSYVEYQDLDVHNPEVTLALQDFIEASGTARTALLKVLPYMWGNRALAVLLEPLYYLHCGAGPVLPFFYHKTQLYDGLKSKYPLFWGNYNRVPRWWIGLAVGSLAQHWHEIVPYDPADPKARFRTPLVRAQYTKPQFTAWVSQMGMPYVVEKPR